MRLRGRFTLWFSLAALIPIAAATVVTREVVARSYRADFESERTDAQARARGILAELRTSASARVKGLASPENELVGGLYIELEKGGGTLPAVEQRRLVQRGRLLMTSLGLDVLFVLDPSDTVLIAPHHRGDLGSVRPELRERAALDGGQGFFALEPVIRGDTIEAVLVAEAGRVISDRGQTVTIVGGQEVDDGVLAKLGDGRRTSARIVLDSGEPILAPPKWSPGTASVIRLPMTGEGGETVAWVELAISDAELAVLLRHVTVAAAVLGSAALLLTIVLGFALARRMTRDLDRLVEGAQAASRDQLDHRIRVRTRDEIGAVASAFNTMLADLQESKERLVTAERIAAWQEIARSLAHEIKNPLTPIQMSVETLRRSHAKAHPSFEEIFDESTQTILEETARLGRIVSEFSEFARMPKPSKGPVDVGEVGRSAVALYRGSIELECSIGDALPTIEADKDQLTQVLLNLLENARDAIAGQAEGRIRVVIREILGGRVIEIRVGDSGPGIADSVRDKIFTPYFTTKGQRGTGLGLATVHRIISDHGGRIRIETSELGGAEFVLALPTGNAPLALTLRSVSPGSSTR